MDADKLARVVRASIDGFAKGYDAASTNEIVVKAGVSKGLLFHYFGSKRQLFLKVFEQCTAQVWRQVWEMVPGPPGDVFQRLTALSVAKLKIARDDPAMVSFLARAVESPPPELKAEITLIQDRLVRAGMARLFDGLDMSSLRPGVAPDAALRLIQLTLNGLSQEYLARGDLSALDWDSALKEFDTLMELLKTGIGR